MARESAGSVPKNTLIFIIFAVFGFILYGNSIPNDYALDDIYVVTENKFTKQGIEGIGNLLSQHFFAGYFGDKEVMLAGGRYRPLSMVTLALEYEFFGKNPQVSHFFNVILYILTAFLLYRILKALFLPDKKIPWLFHIPFVTTMLFMAHPIHTEVVANIKGRDEIMAFLGSLLTLWYILKFIDNEKILYLVYAFVCFFLALMSKEIAATFVFIIPLVLFFFRKPAFKKYLLVLTPLAAATLLIFVIRQAVFAGLKSVPSQELLDNPFIQATLAQKYATIMYTLGLYLKLLFIPHPLTWDYYPYHIPLVGFSDLRTIIPIFIYLMLAVVAIIFLKKRSILSFVIIGFVVSLAPVSNIFFPVGTFMAERFLYLPSLFFCLLLAWAVAIKLPTILKQAKQFQTVSGSLVLIVLVLFSIRVIARNKDWKDDRTLYTHDVEISVNSARGNDIAGEWYAWMANQPDYASQRQECFEKAVYHLRRAVEIHPKYQNAMFQLGNLMYDYKKDIDSTFYFYTRVLELDSNEKSVLRNTGLLLPSITDTAKKSKICRRLYELNPNNFDIVYNLALTYGFTNLSEAVPLMLKAYALQPQKAEVMKFLGSAYYMQKDYQQSARYFEEAVQLLPKEKTLLQDLYFTWQALGNKEKAAEYLRLSQAL